MKRLPKSSRRLCLFISLCIGAGIMLPLVTGAQTATAGDQDSVHAVSLPSESLNTIQRLRDSGRALGAETVRTQLLRSSCQLILPTPDSLPLSATEIRQRARAAHVRLGWVYQCTQCDDWHANLAGGYFLTANGAVATCHHVVQPPRNLRSGGLVVEDQTGTIRPVTEVLAANRHADVCIVRVPGDGFTPLPLNTNITPGDTVYCLSDPQGRRSVFNQGTVIRLESLPERRLETVRGAPLFGPLQVHVTASWGPGSSGSAVLDIHGNAIGHAATITVSNTNRTNGTSAAPAGSGTAVSARDVLSLVHRPAKAGADDERPN